MSHDFNVLEHIGFSHFSKIEDRRSTARFPFSEIIHVAPCTDDPGEGLYNLLRQMTPVPAHDISQTGIAFYLKAKPTASTYLVRLGEIPNAMLMQIRVARTQEGYWDRRRQFRVGCQFQKRIPF